MRLRKFWGWGYDDELLSDEEEKSIDRRIAKTFDLDDVQTIKIPNADDIEIPESKIKSPKSLENLFTDNKIERLNHS